MESVSCICNLVCCAKPFLLTTYLFIQPNIKVSTKYVKNRYFSLVDTFFDGLGCVLIVIFVIFVIFVIVVVIVFIIRRFYVGRRFVVVRIQRLIGH